MSVQEDRRAVVASYFDILRSARRPFSDFTIRELKALAAQAAPLIQTGADANPFMPLEQREEANRVQDGLRELVNGWLDADTGSPLSAPPAPEPVHDPGNSQANWQLLDKYAREAQERAINVDDSLWPTYTGTNK